MGLRARRRFCVFLFTLVTVRHFFGEKFDYSEIVIFTIRHSFTRRARKATKKGRSSLYFIGAAYFIYLSAIPFFSGFGTRYGSCFDGHLRISSVYDDPSINAFGFCTKRPSSCCLFAPDFDARSWRNATLQLKTVRNYRNRRFPDISF